MKNAAQLLAGKDPIVWTVTSDSSVLDAIKIMSEKEIGALLVTESSTLAGIISERDYARKVILKGKESHNTRVSEIMSTNVVSVEPRDSIEKCMSLMTKNKIRHLPVLESGRITGVLSIGDLVKAIIAEQSDTIQHLEGYIMS
ncbi:histidine kinase [Chromatiales bacterium (ex Bugula neritina AB1)]|nr:histidine kinase [Chromatiales bacterium (ex Bugula neritina AB1)]